MNFNDIKPEDYSRETFGESIRLLREERGLTARELADKVGMSAAFLSGIETGKRQAPTGAKTGINYLQRFIEVLNIPQNQVHAFMALAESTSGKYGDINSYLSKNPTARIFLRIADEKKLSEDQWQLLIQMISALNK